MKYISIIFILLFSRSIYGQDTQDSIKRPRVFVSSGMGFGFPIGDIKQTLYPKYSSSLGLTIPFKHKQVFIYPMVDFLSLGYNQDIQQDGYSYTLEKGTAKIYSLSVMPGINRFFGNANVYAFMGPSLQLVYEPRVKIDAVVQSAKIEKMVYLTPGMRGGIGTQYKIGSFNLFMETAWLHNFHEIQEENVNIITLYGGMKTDITRLANKVVSFF